MSTFSVKIDIGNKDGGPVESFEALVDTGAFLSQVPSSALELLGVQRQKPVEVEYADGRVQRKWAGWARIVYEGQEEYTLVVFGEEGVEPILGSFALEGMRLLVDPANERLLPRRFRVTERIS